MSPLYETICPKQKTVNGFLASVEGEALRDFHLSWLHRWAGQTHPTNCTESLRQNKYINKNCRSFNIKKHVFFSQLNNFKPSSVYTS